VERRGAEKEEEIIYQPPYWDMVGIDPSLDEMRKVGCVHQSERRES